LFCDWLFWDGYGGKELRKDILFIIGQLPDVKIMLVVVVPFVVVGIVIVAVVASVVAVVVVDTMNVKILLCAKEALIKFERIISIS
jgi:hypothetical protein